MLTEKQCDLCGAGCQAQGVLPRRLPLEFHQGDFSRPVDHGVSVDAAAIHLAVVQRDALHITR